MIPQSNNSLIGTHDGASKQYSQLLIRHKSSLLLLTSCLLTISLATSCASLWIIWRLGILPGLKLFETDNRGHITIDHDMEADKVFVGNDIIGVETLQGNTAFLAHGAVLSIDDQSITAKAGKDISVVDPFGKILFTTSQHENTRSNRYKLERTNHLASLYGIHNTKRITAPRWADELRIDSRAHAKFSGNQGVQIMAKRVRLAANTSITISSRSSIISLVASESIVFPSLKDCFTDRPDDSRLMGDRSIDLGLSHMCICSNGQVFKINRKDVTTTCMDARFPISENPCL